MLRAVAVAIVLAFDVMGCARTEDENLFHRLSTKAEDAFPAAQYNLGMLYNNGIGVEKDPAKAFHWFERAAAGGDALGHYKVGCYYAGQFRGVVEMDAQKALSHKLQAAEAGYVRAQHDVALAYTQSGNFEEAAKWWRAAAAQGDAAGFTALAGWHKEGRGVPADPAKAYEYFLIATQLVPEQSIEAKSMLEDLRGALDADAIKASLAAAGAWVPRRSNLTARAAEGIEEAKRLAQ